MTPPIIAEEIRNERVAASELDVATDIDRLIATLHGRFGFSTFRPGQEAVIRAVMQGRSALAVLPTGAGKSLCYQLPALLTAGVTVVVSPLIALMKDQVDRLESRGIHLATMIHSGLPPGEAVRRVGEVARGKRSLVYCAPERCTHPAFVEMLARLPVSLFVVDEAHCVSHWGHDFRPDYRALPPVLARMKPRAVLAVTATATPRVRADIIASLGLIDPLVHVASFDRPNLTWRVDRVADREKRAHLRDVLAERPGPAIVYVARRRDAEEVAAELAFSGEKAVPYHAELPSAERVRNQEAFASGEARIIVATVAFGMGVDKPDVRSVIHLHHPGSIEAYYQEAGRAGRDGEPAEARLLFDARDAGLHQYFIRMNYPDLLGIRQAYGHVQGRRPLEALAEEPGWSQSRVNVALGVLETQGFVRRTPGARFTAGDAPPGTISPDLGPMWQRQQGDLERLARMVEYATTMECRRAVLLRYFGDAVPSDSRCDRCDRCEMRGATTVCERVARFLTGGKDGRSRPAHPGGTGSRRLPAQRDVADDRSLPVQPGAMSGAQATRAARSAPGSDPIAGAPPTVSAERMGAAIIAAVRDLQRFHLGVSGVSKVLCGSESHLIERLRLQESPHYGRLTGTPQKEVAESVQRLVAEGRLRRTGGALPAVELVVAPIEMAETAAT